MKPKQPTSTVAPVSVPPGARFAVMPRKVSSLRCAGCSTAKLTAPTAGRRPKLTEITDAMVASARREPSIERVQYLWFFRLIFSPHALAERMTFLWHGHYATSNQKVGNPILMLEQNLSQRELWRSQVSRLHLRMLTDRAMLVWLDGLNSRKAQPNENLAREFLELFALGEGNYTETDIRAAAGPDRLGRRCIQSGRDLFRRS